MEDDERLRSFLAASLAKQGYRVLQAGNGKAAFRALREGLIGLVLLDLRLGDADGLQILRTIRRQDEGLPVIILSATSDPERKVDGFEIGCDDYVTKPFVMEELSGRIKRLLKRSRTKATDGRGIQETIRSGPFLLDVPSFTVRKHGRPIAMRRRLYELFLYFVRHPGQVVSNEMLLENGLRAASGATTNNLYVHVRELRKLVEDDPARPRHILTKRNVGYVYEADP